MARTVVYPAPATGLMPAQPGDQYLEKIAKFVPAEVLAFYVPALVQFTGVRLDLWTYLLGLVATPAYLWFTSRNLTPESLKPKAHFYALAMLSFAIWGFAGFHDVQAAVHFKDASLAAWILTAWVFAVPVIDAALLALLKRLFPKY